MALLDQGGLRLKTALDNRGAEQQAQGLQVNNRGELLVAGALPALASLVALGDSWEIHETADVAPIVAPPTTTAELTLWNGEPLGSGNVYVIDSVFAFVTVSSAAATALALLACLNQGAKAAPTSGLTTFKSLSGRSTYPGKAVCALAATVTDDKWHPIGNSVTTAAAQIGAVIDVPVNGLYIIPPQRMFSLAVFAETATTIKVRCGLRWHEVAMPYVE